MTITNQLTSLASCRLHAVARAADRLDAAARDVRAAVAPEPVAARAVPEGPPLSPVEQGDPGRTCARTNAMPTTRPRGPSRSMRSSSAGCPCDPAPTASTLRLSWADALRAFAAVSMPWSEVSAVFVKATTTPAAAPSVAHAPPTPTSTTSANTPATAPQQVTPPTSKVFQAVEIMRAVRQLADRGTGHETARPRLYALALDDADIDRRVDKLLEERERAEAAWYRAHT